MNFRAVTLSTAAAAAAVILSGCCCKTVYDCKFNVGAPAEKFAVSKAAGSVKLDGVLDAKEWKGAEIYSLVRAYRYADPKTTPAKVYAHTSKKGSDVEPLDPGTVRMMYDNNYLYIGAQLTDRDMIQYAAENQAKLAGQGDAFILYIKPANSPSYWECQVAPNGKIASFFVPTRGYPANPEETLMPGMKASVKVQGTINKYQDTDKGWTVELAIPLAQLKKAGAEFKPGSAWTILAARRNYNFNVLDTDPQDSSVPEMPCNSFSYIEYFADVIWK